MTQEEKVAINTKTPEEKDNAILQNELLSKLINTPPNLSIKYENEELNKFKDEILLYLNERNKHFLTLIKYFQDKMTQTRDEYTSKLNLIHQNYESILSSQASIINKLDKYSNFDLFMNKTNDQMITHEIRINNLSQDFIKAVQKYDKIYLDNLELPGYIGKFAKFKNCQAFFDFVIREIDKTNLYKEKNNIDLKNNKDRLDNTIKSFNLLFKNNNEAQMKYIKQINEKNFKECKDMNEALSNRVCDLRIENAKYSIDLIKKSEEMGKDWNKILSIKDEMLETVNEKINSFRKIFNGNTTLFNEFRKEYEEFKIKINEIFNYFKEIKTMNENNNMPALNNHNNNPCNNYTGCYINSNLPSEKKSFKHFSKFAKRSKSKNTKHFDKKIFIKSYMTINGNKNISENIINNKESNNGSSNHLIHIECMNKEKRNKIFQNENLLKKSAYTTVREPRSSKSVTKIEINSLNKVYSSSPNDEFKNNNLLNSLKNENNKNDNKNKNEENNNNKNDNKKIEDNNNDNNNNEDEHIQIKINEEENKQEEINNSYNQSEINVQGKTKLINETSKDTINSLNNMNKENEKEKILMKMNKKARKSFAPSSKSINSYEPEINNNLNDISNITSAQKTDDVNLMNFSLYSTNSFNSNTNSTNKFILNDINSNNINERNSQVIKELASELEQSTNKKDILNSNKKKIEESFKINRNKISKLNLIKGNNINYMDVSNSTEKTDDINKLHLNNNNNMNNNINISINSTNNNKNINPNCENVNTNINNMNKKMDLFDKKLFNLEALLKEKIIEILNQMEKIQNFFKFSFSNKIQITSRPKNPSNFSNKETNFNFNNFNINTTPNINLGKNEISYEYITNTNNINNLNKRNSQDDYFVGCTVKRLAPIIEIDVNNLQFSPSPTRTQFKVFSSKRKDSRNKFIKNGVTTNFKDIKLKRNENKENLKPSNTNIDGLNSSSNNNGTQIRVFGKGGNTTGTGVNKWINLNKLINYDKSIKENNSNTALI